MSRPRTHPTKGHPLSSFLYRLGQAAARHRWRTLGIWIAAVVAIFVIGGALGGTVQRRLQPAGLRVAARLRPAGRAIPRRLRHLGVHRLPRAERPARGPGRRRERRAGRRSRVSRTSSPSRTRSRPRAPCRPTARSATRRSPTTSRPSDLGVEPFEALQATLEDVRSPDLEAEIGGEYASWGTQPEHGHVRADRPAGRDDHPADRVRLRGRDGPADRRRP